MNWLPVTPAIPDPQYRRQIYAGEGGFFIARMWRREKTEMQVFYTFEQTPEYGAAQQARAQ